MGINIFQGTKRPDREPFVHFCKTITFSIICNILFLADDCVYMKQCLHESQSTVNLLFYFFIHQVYSSSIIDNIEHLNDKETVLIYIYIYIYIYTHTHTHIYIYIHTHTRTHTHTHIPLHSYSATSRKFWLKWTWRLTKAIAEMKSDTEQMMGLDIYIYIYIYYKTVSFTNKVLDIIYNRAI